MSVWFERCGVSKEITHISYARQGLDREPTIHLGARVKTLEDRGLLTDRSKKNRDIKMRNHERDRLIFREHMEKDRERGLSATDKYKIYEFIINIRKELCFTILNLRGRG